MALIVYTLGVTLHSYFRSRAGHSFHIKSLLFLTFIAAPYTLHALAALFAHTAMSRILLLVAVGGIVAIDIHCAGDWSSEDSKEAPITQGIILIAETGLSIFTCMFVAILGMPYDDPTTNA
jgi:hypothetical protein